MSGNKTFFILFTILSNPHVSFTPVVHSTPGVDSSSSPDEACVEWVVVEAAQREAAAAACAADDDLGDFERLLRAPCRDGFWCRLVAMGFWR